MTDPNIAYLALLLGGIGLAHTLHAITTGKNAFDSARLDRAIQPKMFWLITVLEGLMSLGLIRLAVQILKWI
jgi:hypothetical protein